MNKKYYRNKFAAHKSVAEKNIAYHQAVADGAVAYKSDHTTVPLAEKSPAMVELVGGLWRVQDDFPYSVQEVRGVDFVLVEKLSHTEKTLFEFYKASMVGENCYGRYLADSPYIVAKYTTNDGTFWGYGSSIEQARAFLGIKLYDEYKDLIHKHACQKINPGNKK